MTRRTAIFLLIVLTASLATADEGTPSQEPRPRTIIIGTESEYPPYSFRGEDDLATGYNAELAQAVARAVGLNARIRIGPWDQIRHALEAGEIDAVCGMYYSLERKKQVDFTLPFTIVHHAIFARTDAPEITSEEQLKGRKLIVMRGDIMHDYVKDHGLCDDPILAATQADALRQLAAGEGEYALVAKLPGLYWIKRLQFTNLKIVGPLLAPSKYCFAVKKNNFELLGRLNEGMAIITETGQHRQIYDAWFRTLEEERPHDHYLLKHILMIVLPLVGLLAASVAWLWTVRRQVRRATASLRNEIQRHKTLMSVSLDGIAIISQEHQVIEANQCFADMLGYTLEEALRLHTWDWQADMSEAAIRSSYVDLTQTHSRFETHHRRKNGTVFPVEVSLSGANIGGESMVYTVTRDITSRRRAEEALRESEAKYRTVVEQAGEAVFLHDKHGRILEVNRKACENLGYTRDELLNKPIQEIDPEAFESGIVTSSVWDRVFAGEQFRFESRHRRKGGDVFPVEVTLGVVNLPVGKAVLGIVRDITERKRAEEELQKLNEELEQRVAQRTKELESRVNEVEHLNAAMVNLSDDLRKTNHSLEQTARGLETANQELEAFSYSVSHDLRAPLRAMDGFSQAVLEDFGDRLDETGRDYLRRIRAAAQHMGKLIDAILELSRASRVDMTSQSVDLSSLAAQIAEELRRTEPNRQVEIIIAPDLTCRGDENLLRQLLTNLLENAWKFTTPRPRGWIEFTTISGEQAAAAGRPGQTVYVLRDNGVGFDMHYASKLFNAFQRLHSREEFPGTGVGLATVQRIVRRHGGDVWAEGTVDQGASIYFTLGKI